MAESNTNILEWGENKDWLKATVDIHLYDIIDMDIDMLNDYAQEEIVGDGKFFEDVDDRSAFLSNISYNVVGFDKNENIVQIEVYADIDYM